MVQIVDSVPDVLVWQIPHDAASLPADLLAALADPAAPGVVALADRHPIRWFQEALRLGVDDVLCLPQTPQSLGMAAAKARAARSRRAPLAAAGRRRRARVHRLLHQGRFGPHRDRHEPGRLVRPGGPADAPRRPRPAVGGRRARARPGPPDDRARPGGGTRRSRCRRASPMPSRATPAGPTSWPRRPGPRRRSWSRVDRLGSLLRAARAVYEVVVIDAASSFSPTTLLALDHTDTLILVGRARRAGRAQRAASPSRPSTCSSSTWPTCVC